MELSRVVVAMAISVLTSLILGVVVHGATSAEPSTGQSEIVVEWDFRPGDVDELATGSDAVIRAIPTGVRPGPSISSEDEAATYEIPTRLVDLHVEEVLAGNTPEDLTLFQLGDDRFQVEDDPTYELGSEYLLFVRKRDSQGGHQQTWIAAAPDGRFLRTSDGYQRTLTEASVVTDQLEEMTPAEIGVASQQAMEAATPTEESDSPDDAQDPSAETEGTGS